VILALPARAKLNLDLAVVGRRPDGKHELRTRMQAVDLHDLLEVEAADEKTTLTVTGFELEPKDGNTVLKAHAALEAAAGHKLPATYTLHKRIPPGSGLGGASSDAAAALVAIKLLRHLDVELDGPAQQVGSDVPFFLGGGAALVEAAGERVTPIPVAGSWYAIAWPGIVLRTGDVYAAYDEVGGEEPNELRRAAGRVSPELADFESRLGTGWRMTGSGSAFFCACADRDSAKQAVAKLDCWTAVTAAVGSWR
jgi:4-diphosphocytidyl-2-C-methyl-D-erythritol kinase